MMGSDENVANDNMFGSTDNMENLPLDHPLYGSVPLDSSTSGEGFASALSVNAEEEDPLSDSRPFGSVAARPAPGQRGGPSLGGRTVPPSSQRNSFSNVDERTLVEPPSYADAITDAIFTPFPGDGTSAMNGGTRRKSKEGPETFGTSSSRGGATSAADAITITVSDPQKVTPETSTSIVGSGSYVTYLVTTRTRMPGYSREELSVRRRFRDFVALADRLGEVYRGYFVPPRPDKNLMESQVMHSKEFVDMRRVSLEKYMQRLAHHPVIRRSEELRMFLEADGKLPLAANADLASRVLDGATKLPRQLFGAEGAAVAAPAEPAAKSSVDLMRMFKELRQTVANDWGSKPAVTEEDKEYLDKKDKLLDLEKHLMEASQQAEQLLKGQQELGEVVGELGLSFIGLAKFEDSGTSAAQKALAGESRRFGNAAIRMSRLSGKSNNIMVHHLAQLHEYLALMQACHTAFADRSSAMLTMQTHISDLETKTQKIEKLKLSASKVFGGDKSRTRQISDLEKEVSATEAAKQAAEQDYETMKERNWSEIERFDAERLRDFYHMIDGFVRTQVGFAERSRKIWDEELEAFKNAGGKKVGEGSVLSTAR